MEKPQLSFQIENKGLRKEWQKVFLFIVTAFEVTLKLTQQVSKNCKLKNKRTGKRLSSTETRAYVILLRHVLIFSSQ